MKIDTNEVNKIIKKVIGHINSSRGQILNILDNVRSEYENLKLELVMIRAEINNTILEVDLLEKQDKVMRQKLVEVSKNFKIYSEFEVKYVYEAASDIRVKFLSKSNEEKALKVRRTRLEIDFKKLVDNLESSEKVINQISIALGYLEGDVFSTLGNKGKDSEMFIGIKILEAQENERKRIARDIHDGPAQHMANVVMRVDICKKVIEKDLVEGFRELEELKESVKVALMEVRNIIFDLRPMSLDDLGLNQTIEQTVKKISEETGLVIELKLKPMEQEIESIIQVAIYRIIQEVFNNIKKHAKASCVVVKLDYGTKYLMLNISDDGIGFDVEETLERVKTKSSSYGLLGILDRVNQLQGEINIESTKKIGTVYKVKLPINREVIKDEN
ncbi:MAG: sensor histidine kinase [Clostridiaceae bacterium]|nr:sensor histidine kinase [Clostridiaceae bacterium]